MTYERNQRMNLDNRYYNEQDAAAQRLMNILADLVKVQYRDVRNICVDMDLESINNRLVYQDHVSDQYLLVDVAVAVARIGLREGKFFTHVTRNADEDPKDVNNDLFLYCGTNDFDVVRSLQMILFAGHAGIDAVEKTLLRLASFMRAEQERIEDLDQIKRLDELNFERQR